MSFNSDLVDIYLGNLTPEGRRICTFVHLAEKHGVSPQTLSRISSIQKYSTKEAFQLFTECMYKEEAVMLSNGTSSSNIEHIALLIRKGNSITGKGKAPIAYNRADCSCVYLLEVDGYYKTGVTPDTLVERRIKALQVGNPHKISLVIKTGTISNAYDLEKLLHEKFKINKVYGGWFKLEENNLKPIIKILKEAK